MVKIKAIKKLSMVSSIKVSNEGLAIHNENSKILLDPSKIHNDNFVFVSHAHSDHIYKKPKSKTTVKTLVSKETELIANARGYEISNPIYEEKNLELIDTGHILGSKGLLAFNEVYYTGDISIRKRGFMIHQNKIPKVDKLIIESTFGKPEFIFPDPKEIVHETNQIISDAYEKGIPVIIMGYSLGKAQLLVDLFRHWDPFYVSDSIENINTIYRKMKIPLRDLITYSEAEKNYCLSKKPWIMLSSLMTGRSKFLQSLKEKYNAITIGFSGWACNPGYRYMMGLDYAMPLSDHCDYNELLEVVGNSNPKKVYTIHGFSEDFARTLRDLGYEAEPITNGHIKKKGTTKSQKNNKNANLKKIKKNPILDSFFG